MSGPEPGWFNEVAAFLGSAYLRNAFTLGTEQEVGFLVEALGLEAGDRVLDVGCGPGRHALALARRGIDVTGVDLSPDFVALARDAARTEDLPTRFDVLDVRELTFRSEFDAVICLCQGGFGLLGGDEDAAIIRRLAAALRADGRLALTAFSAYFAVRHLEPGEEFDARTGVLHERATVRDPAGLEQEFDLWTTCFTARELRGLAEDAGLVVDGIHGVSPGAYGIRPPGLEHHELLVVAHVSAVGLFPGAPSAL